MTDKKFSLTKVSVTKLQFCISYLRKKKALWPGIIQQPANASSRRIGVKTAKPGVDRALTNATPKIPRTVPKNP